MACRRNDKVVSAWEINDVFRSIIDLIFSTTPKERIFENLHLAIKEPLSLILLGLKISGQVSIKQLKGALH
jgi:hypothetical protein